jgi:hypothetical protein
MKKTILLLFIFTSISCDFLKQQEKIKLIIINHSSNDIDSIKFTLPNHNEIINIKAGKQDSLEVYFKEPDLKQEGSFYCFLFQKNMKSQVPFGFHDWGKIFKNSETIYLTDNGYTNNGKPIEKPEEFEISIYNKLGRRIDTAYTDTDCDLKFIRWVNNEYDELSIKLNFTKFSEKPIIKIKAGKDFRLDFSFHDWKHWNYNKEMVYLYEDGISLTPK